MLTNEKLIPKCPNCDKEMIVQSTYTGSNNTMTSLCSRTNCNVGYDTDWEIIWTDKEVLSIKRYYFG